MFILLFQFQAVNVICYLIQGPETKGEQTKVDREKLDGEGKESNQVGENQNTDRTTTIDSVTLQNSEEKLMAGEPKVSDNVGVEGQQ